MRGEKRLFCCVSVRICFRQAWFTVSKEFDEFFGARMVFHSIVMGKELPLPQLDEAAASLKLKAFSFWRKENDLNPKC